MVTLHSFNLDNSVNIEAEVDVKTMKVCMLWIAGGYKSAGDVLGFIRTRNVTACVELMLHDHTISSCKTECGVTVRKGVILK